MCAQSEEILTKTLKLNRNLAGTFGHMDAFDKSAEGKDTYIQRLEQYCLVNHIEDDQKIAVLLSIMGAKT